jgi:hypothetical protein
MFHAFRTHKLSFFRFTTLPVLAAATTNQSALLETQDLQHIHILSRHFCIFIRMNISYGRNSKVSDTFLRILMLSHRQFEKLSILERLAFKEPLKTYGICNFQLYLLVFSNSWPFLRFLLRRAQLVKKVTAICMLDLRNILCS